MYLIIIIYLFSNKICSFLNQAFHPFFKLKHTTRQIFEIYFAQSLFDAFTWLGWIAYQSFFAWHERVTIRYVIWKLHDSISYLLCNHRWLICSLAILSWANELCKFLHIFVVCKTFLFFVNSWIVQFKNIWVFRYFLLFNFLDLLHRFAW